MHVTNHQQKGMALAIVLIFLFIMTLVSVTALSTSQKQERMSAHKRQHTDALHAAEFGLERAASTLREAVNSGLTIPAEEVWVGSEISDSLDVHWVSAETAETFGFNGGSSYFLEEIRFADGGVQLTSVGHSTGVARRRITSTFRINPGSGTSSPFQGPLTACESVNISGSGAIRSYDSLNPGAGEQYRANVSIREAGGEVRFNGASSIYGSVEGPADTGHFGGNLFGDFSINGNITTNSGTRVCGQVSTRGSFTSGGNFHLGNNAHTGCAAAEIASSGIRANDISLNNSANVTGTLNAAGNLSTSGNTNIGGGSHNIAGNVNRQGSSNIGDRLSYGGSHAESGNHSTAELVHVPGLEALLPPVIPPRTCEPDGIEIAQIMASNLPQTDAVLDGNLPPMIWDSPSGLLDYLEDRGMDLGHLQDFDSDTSLTVRVTGNANLTGYRQLEFPENKNVTMRIDGNFDLGGSASLLIPSNVDVAFYVGGAINFGGSGSIHLGANSTLTFYVRGNANLGNNPLQFSSIESVVERFNDHGESYLKPRLTYYSDVGGNPTLTSGDNIQIGGSSNLYGAFYAPGAQVGLRGSGQLRGSVWAKSIQISGNSEIMYDVQLGGDPDGSMGASGAQFSRASWSEIIQ